jgi:hypothetical protein
MGDCDSLRDQRKSEISWRRNRTVVRRATGEAPRSTVFYGARSGELGVT